QEEYRQYSEEMDRKARERAPLTLPSPPTAGGEGRVRGTGDAADPLAGPVWQASFVNWDALAGPDASPRQALWALSFPLAELAGDLQDRPAGTDLLRSLNGAY